MILSMLIFFWIAVTCSFAFDFIKGDESEVGVYWRE